MTRQDTGLARLFDERVMGARGWLAAVNLAGLLLSAVLFLAGGSSGSGGEHGSYQ